MIPPFILIIVFTVFFLVSFTVILRRKDDLCALAYLTLFVYTIFTQIVYAYYPELSQDIGGFSAYFGESLFYDYWLFMFMSFVASYLIYLLVNSGGPRRPLYFVKKNNAKLGRCVFYIIVMALIGVMLATFLIRGDEIVYGGVEDALINEWFALGYRMLVLIAIVLYARYRILASSASDKRMAIILFIISTILIFEISIKGGVRSTLLYFAIGLGMFELHPFISNVRQYKRKLLFACLLIIPLMYVLSAMEYARAFFPQTTLRDFWAIIGQPGEIFALRHDLPFFLYTGDYYIPSHLLFVVMANNFVDTGEVLKSNLANILVFLDYPTLSQTITGNYIYAGDQFGRYAGWAFHLFIEGYVAAGWLGIIYNAVVWNAGMYLWKRIASSGDKQLNLIITALFATMIISLMRAQSYWFIKYIWLSLLPVMGLLFLSNGWRPVFLKKKAITLMDKNPVLSGNG